MYSLAPWFLLLCYTSGVPRSVSATSGPSQCSGSAASAELDCHQGKEDTGSLLQSRTQVVKSEPAEDEMLAVLDGLRQSVKNLREEVVKSDHEEEAKRLNSDSCAILKNKGSHFTVAVNVGTPAQTFDVVADTGSNALIVSSCICQEVGLCPKSDKCFTGMHKSSSFDYKTHDVKGEKMPTLIRMAFGSGTVDAAVATDVVSVGTQTARMDQSLMLMVAKKLDFSGAFEGILGLGLPTRESNNANVSKTSHEKFVVMAQKPTTKPEQEYVVEKQPLGFLEKAKVPRFSMCFTSGGDGIMRLNQPPMQNLLAGIGSYHWALELAGMSVGKASRALSFCSPSSKLPGQATACAAVPDSGTTLMMGPQEQIYELYAELCNEWPRCQKHVSEKHNVTERAILFQEVLFGCNDYVTESHGLDEELPPLRFHFKGADNTKQEAKLAGAGYVLETMEDEVHYVTKHLPFLNISIKLPMPTGKKKLVCTAAFGEHGYKTALNGPVWIIGLPLFYEYQVGYDLASKPPGVSFSKESCGKCSTSGSFVADPSSYAASLEEDATQTRSKPGVARRPRRLHGPARLPAIDLNQPL